jgi:hypothetical protein
MHFQPLLALAMATAQPLPPPAQEPSSPPLPASQELIEGWEVSPGAGPPKGDCDDSEVTVRALNPPEREEAVRLLEKDIARPLSEAEAARLLGRGLQHEKPLATALLEERLDQLRSVRDCIMLRQFDRCKPENEGIGWGPADEAELGKLVADYERGDHRIVRPYLVRGVAKFGDGHGGPPVMLGGLCGGDLLLTTFVFSYTDPPSERVPAVVFLPRPPERIWASVHLSR